jgi:hypothetical protein
VAAAANTLPTLTKRLPIRIAHFSLQRKTACLQTGAEGWTHLRAEARLKAQGRGTYGEQVRLLGAADWSPELGELVCSLALRMTCPLDFYDSRQSRQLPPPGWEGDTHCPCVSGSRSSKVPTCSAQTMVATDDRGVATVFITAVAIDPSIIAL